ncbi:hypothetical protein B0H65DRAFT_439587 [Neurospora tetraspora]|uniref:C2H2-type domain-containing protein n=1 Tax=Neurospora tetraspora TaxID=94610 RepID=A0AAE0JKB9_9PEZI|nr:hypothetical protein B0H65DRAFT_439587 [Neurospora tetraspora]
MGQKQYCNEPFQTQSKLDRHYTSQRHQNKVAGIIPNENSEFHCGICNTPFKNAKALREHRRGSKVMEEVMEERIQVDLPELMGNRSAVAESHHGAHYINRAGPIIIEIGKSHSSHRLELKVDDSCLVQRDAHHRSSDACGRADDGVEGRKGHKARVEAVGQDGLEGVVGGGVKVVDSGDASGGLGGEWSSSEVTNCVFLDALSSHPLEIICAVFLCVSMPPVTSTIHTSILSKEAEDKHCREPQPGTSHTTSQSILVWLKILLSFQNFFSTPSTSSQPALSLQPHGITANQYCQFSTPCSPSLSYYLSFVAPPVTMEDTEMHSAPPRNNPMDSLDEWITNYSDPDGSLRTLAQDCTMAPLTLESDLRFPARPSR